MKINIICPDNGVGLSKDRQILARLFSGGEVNFCTSENPKPGDRADINIFCETLFARYIPLASRNYIFPNPEWFYRQWLPHLRYMNTILCKTQDCQRIFGQYGKTLFTSFTSFDMMDEGTKRTNTFAHFQGKSQAKGTKETVAAFERANMKLHRFSKDTGWLTPDQYVQEFNRHKFHLCCSCYEGFGHYINEAKSVGAIIVTTDAPPMNELITKKTGCLVGFDRMSTQNMAMMRHPSTHAIGQAIEYLAKMKQADIDELSRKSRDSFWANDKFFRERMLNMKW